MSLSPSNLHLALIAACKILGITPQEAHPLTSRASYEERCRLVEEFKALAKRRWRAAVKQHHPDHNGSKEQFNRVQHAYQFLRTLQAQPDIPPPQSIRVDFTFRTSSTTSGSSSYCTQEATVWHYT